MERDKEEKGRKKDGEGERLKGGERRVITEKGRMKDGEGERRGVGEKGRKTEG